MPKSKMFDEEEVLQKALFLFWKKGYYDTSIQDLVDFLGINRGSLYATYGGKKKLFNQAFNNYRINNKERLKQFLALQKDTKQGLRNIFEKIISNDCADSDNKGCFIVNTTTELIPLDKGLEKIIRQHRIDSENLFYDYLQKGVRQQQISASKNLKVISNLLYTLMTGIRVTGKTKPPFAESMASIDAVLSLLD